MDQRITVAGAEFAAWIWGLKVRMWVWAGVGVGRNWVGVQMRGGLSGTRTLQATAT